MASGEGNNLSRWRESGACWEHDPTAGARRRLLLAALCEYVSPTDAVLDLGCGTGVFSSIIACAGYPVVGVDVEEEAVAHAVRGAPQLDFRLLNDNGTIPAADGYFGAVWSSEVVEHVFDIKRHVTEVNRVLKPGGIYIITTPYHGIVKNLLISLLRFSRHFNPMGQHIRFFDKAGLMRYLRYGGFEFVSARGLGRIWPVHRTWFAVARKRES